MTKGAGLLGVGSTVVVMRGKRVAKILLAIYWNGACWMIFDGDNHIGLDGLRVTLSKGWWFLGLFQRASLILDGPAMHRTVVYFRPTLRQWFVDGWKLDDVDIGCMIADLVADEHARERVLKGMQKQVAE